MKSAKSLKKQKRYLEMAWRWACFISFKTCENDRWPTSAHRYLPVTTKWFFFTKPAQAPKISAGIEREGAQRGNVMNFACATSQSKLEICSGKFEFGIFKIASTSASSRDVWTRCVNKWNLTSMDSLCYKTQGDSCHKGIIWKEKYFVVFG